MRGPQIIALALALPLACSPADDALPGNASMGDGAEDVLPDVPDFEVRYRTKYFDIAPGFAQPICRGTLDELDRYMDSVAELLDIRVDRRTTIYWYNEHAVGARADSSCDWCPSSCGCYAGYGVVHADRRIVHHEVVHALVSPAWGRSDIVFSEGIAMGLDRIEEYARGVTSVHSLASSERPTEVAGGTQHGGGHFTRWIIDRYGAATLRELFPPRLDGSATQAEVFAAVEEVFGVSFETLEAEYLATAATIYPALGLCDGLVHVPWSGDRWELRVTAECDALHVFGPLDVDATEPTAASAPLAVVVTVDVPAELDGVPLVAWIPSGERASLTPCLDEPLVAADPALAASSALSQSLVNALPAGRYRLELPVDEPGDVYMRICPHNGAPPRLDPTEDPEHCLE